jgi:DNA-binding response OmpR family regulator
MGIAGIPLDTFLRKRTRGLFVGTVVEMEGRSATPSPRSQRPPLDEWPLSSRLRILIADDEPEMRATLAGLVATDPGLELAGVAEDADEAVEVARVTRPDVALLDVSMPGGGGPRAAVGIRWRSPRTNLVAFSMHDDKAAIVDMLRAGAVGYVVKGASCEEILDALRWAAQGRGYFPLNVVRELAAEEVADPDTTWLDGAEVPAITRVLRPRAVPAGPPERPLGRLVIDTDAREVYVDGVEVELTRLEFDLLETLSARPRVVFTRAKLLELVWGPDWFGDDHVVDVHISSLRRKIGDDPQAPRFIRTVRGVGYRIGEGPSS